MAKNLKDSEIRGAKATGKRRELIDGDGLYLDVTPTGGKIWRYRYRLHGRREKVTIGHYPSISLAQARADHLVMAAKVAKGESPAREKKHKQEQRKQAGTVAELAELYWEDLAARSKDGGKGSKWKFDAHIVPKLGHLSLHDVTPAEVLAFLDGIKKTAPVAALAVHGTLKRMFDFAGGRQLMATNPAKAIPSRVIGEAKPRERALTPQEIGILLRNLDEAKGEPATLMAFRLLLLTMVRRNELTQATWDEVDLDNALWEIPSIRSKNGKAHLVPLSRQVVFLLKDFHDAYGGKGLVLPGRKPSKGIAVSTLHESMKRNGYFGLAHFTPHDFRRTASTILNEQGWFPDVIEKALNHTMGGVRGIYTKAQYLDQRREMLQAWADLLDALKAGAKVVPIGKKRTA